MTGLTAGIIIPNVLRWYWWRMNGWGYAAGTLVGMLLAFIPLLDDSTWPMYQTFPLVVAGSSIATIAATLLTAPVDDSTLRAFYTQIRPFGAWGHIAREVKLPKESGESAGRTILNVLLAMIAVHACYLAPMYLVGHWYLQGTACIAVVVAMAAALYFTWYKHLPAPGT
jgi:hypothetical protein